MLSCAPVLLPFAASRVSWAAGRACGPTQSDEAACQHLGEGGSDPPSWSRLLFQVVHTVSATRLFFCLVRIASYHVCSRGQTPSLPCRPACTRCQGDDVMTFTDTGVGSWRDTAVTSQVRHHYRDQQPLSFLQETRGGWEVGKGGWSVAKLDLCLKKFQRHGGSWCWSPPLPVTSCPMQRRLHGRCQFLAFLVRRSVRSGPYAARPEYTYLLHLWRTVD